MSHWYSANIVWILTPHPLGFSTTFWSFFFRSQWQQSLFQSQPIACLLLTLPQMLMPLVPSKQVIWGLLWMAE